MNERSDPRLIKRLSFVASAAGIVPGLIGLSVLAGWTFHVGFLLTWGAGTPMAPNAAGCAVLASTSLWLLKWEDSYSFGVAKKLAARIAAGIVAVVGLLSLAEHLFDLNFGIDRLLLGTSLSPQTASARVLMSPVAAGFFLLYGCALLGIDWRTRRGDWPAQFLSIGAMIGAAFGLFGLILGPGVSFITMALPAVLSYFLLTSGLLCSRPTWAVGGLLVRQSQGASLVRKAVPGALLALSLVGMLISRALLTESHFTWIEVSLLGVFCSVLLASFIAWMAFLVERANEERETIEETQHIGEEQLARLLNRVEEPQDEKLLRRKVNFGFAVAVLLTIFLSALSWRASQLAAEDADWVAHTHEVSTTLEFTLRHLDDVETGGRGFALTGDDQFLEPFEAGKYAVGQDLQALHHLVADNPNQLLRLNVLVQQAKARVVASGDLAASRRNSGALPTVTQLERGKDLMDAVRGTIAEMETEENRLLELRTQRTRSAQRVNNSAIGLGSILGIVFLSLAGMTVSREIGVSAKSRAQVNALNEALEERVEQRTAALQSEIAARTSMEAKLRASEEMFRMLLDGIKDYAVYMLDPEGRVMSWNSGAARMKGYQAKEIIGKDFSCFYTETDRNFHLPQESLKRAALTGRFEGEGWRVRKDGSKFWADAVITPVFEANGTLRGYSKIVRDVTDRKRAEDELKEQATLLDLAHDAILVRDLQNRVIFWNRGAQNIYGWSGGEALGRVTHDFLQTKFPQPLDTIEVTLASKGDWEGELRHKTRYGTEVVVASRWSLQRDARGLPAAIMEINRDITDRKRAEAAVSDSEGRLAGIIASAMDSIITVNEQQRIVLFNCAAEKMFRCPAEEAIGQPLTRFIPERFHAGHAEHIRKFGETGVTNRAMGPKDVLWALRADGQEFQIEASISHVLTGGKKLFTVILRDVTERKRSEEIRERLAAVVDSSDDAIISKDLNGTINAWNRGAEKVFGYSPAEAIGKPMMMLFPPDRMEEESDILARIRRGESVEHYETERLRKDGTKIVVSVTISPIRDDTRAIVGASKIARDITERKRAEEALRESENRFRTLIDQASDAFFLHDSDGRFLEVNRQACESLGYTREELLRMSVFDIEQGIDKREAQQALKQAEPGRPYTLQGHQRRKDGTAFPVEARLSAYYFDGQKLHLGLVRDTTERMRAEEALRRSDAGRAVALEAANLGEWEIDLTTQETRRSWRHDQIFGYASPTEWSPDIFFQHVHPDDRARARMNLEAAVSQGTKLETECRIIGPDGEVRWIRACGDLYRDSEGNSTRMFGTVEDITGRKNIAEALRIGEERLRLAMDGAQLGTWHWNLETGELVWSPRSLALFGLPRDTNMSYEIFLGALHPDDRIPTDQAVRRSLAEHSGYDIEYRALWPDGTLHWIAAKGQAYYDAAGKATRMEGVLIDVTERKQAEAALRESQTNFAAVVNLAPQFVWICTNDGLNVYFNDRWFQYTGLTPEQSRGRGWNAPFHPDDKQTAWDHWSRATATGETYSVESRLRAADGSYRWFLMRGEPVREEDGRIVKWFGTCTEIDDIKRAQAELRESEERFHAMLNGIPQLAWMAEADGRIFWYNQRWYEYTGTSSEQMEGWGWQSVHDPEALPNVLEKWKSSIAHGMAFDMEFPLRAADGSFGVFLTRVMPLKDANGQVLRWFGTNTDISERTRTEKRLSELARELSLRAEELTRSREALEAQTTMFKLVLASIGEGLIAADQEGRFLIFNDAAHRLMGRGPESLPTEEWTQHYKVFLPDGITPYPPANLPLVRALRGESVQVELIVQPPDALPSRSLEVAARPLRDARGNPCGGVAVLHDVTERKRSERELAQKADELFRSRQDLETQTLMLQSVLDSMEEGLVVADEQGKFIIWNPAAARIVGLGGTHLPPEEWRAHYRTYLPDTVTLFPADQNPLLRAIRGEASTAEMFIRNPKLDHGIWIESNGAALRDKSGVLRGGVVAFRDITQKKSDELMIRKLNEDLEERIAQRTAQLEAANRELEAFTYSVSHDLRAPIRHISSFSRILSEDFGSTMDPEARRLLERIENGTRRMTLLVDGLLSLARIGPQSLKLSLTELNAVVDGVISVLQPECEGRDVEWRIAKLPALVCDPILMGQVFQNLIGNALKYSGRRAKAVIEIDSIQQAGKPPVIFVRDNGAGFSMQYADKLFGVFQRMHQDSEFEGTGVGLATVHRIIQKHGGSIWAEAEVDHGATFYFTVGQTAPIEMIQQTTKNGALEHVHDRRN